MSHQIKIKPPVRPYSEPIFGSCLTLLLWAGVAFGLNACSPQFKAAVLSTEDLVQDAELFVEPVPQPHSEAPPENPLEAPANPPSDPNGTLVETTPDPVPADPPSEDPPPERQLDVTVVTPTDTNGGTSFSLRKEFKIQDVEIDEHQKPVAVEKTQKIDLLIEMVNFRQNAKENNSVETSVSADLGLERLVELKTSFTRIAPRRLFKRGRWHIQAECQFHPTENKCEMVSYLVHVKFSFDRKSNPPLPQVHLENALAFYVLENSESVFHYKILPASFRNFTQLVTEMKSHANQGE